LREGRLKGGHVPVSYLDQFVPGAMDENIFGLSARWAIEKA